MARRAFISKTVFELDRIQITFAHYKSRVHQLPYSERLNILNLVCVRHKLLRGDVILTYKCLKDELPESTIGINFSSQKKDTRNNKVYVDLLGL